MFDNMKMALVGLRYPHLITLFENILEFGTWLSENVKVDKEEFAELKEYVQKRFEDADEDDDEAIKKAIVDSMTKAMKVISKYAKASKYDKDKNILKLVLQDKEKRKVVFVIAAKVVE